jgi:hypothetical protein
MSHPEMIKARKEIANVFQIFHDGDIIFDCEEETTQTWKIDCQYLAEIINHRFHFFWVKIINCNLMEFTPWMNQLESPKETWKTSNKIFQTELEILSAKESNKTIEIICNQIDTRLNYRGGNLILDCEGIKIFDQDWNNIEYERLRKICSDYWNKK